MADPQQKPSVAPDISAGDVDTGSMDLSAGDVGGTPTEESPWARAYHAVGSGYQAPMQDTAQTVEDVVNAVSTPHGIKNLLAKYPAKHQGVLGTLADAYGGMLPIDVRRDESGSVDLPATLGASVGKLGSMLTMGKIGQELAPEADVAAPVKKSVKSLITATDTATSVDLPDALRVAAPELQRTVQLSGAKPEGGVPNLAKVTQKTLTRLENDFNVGMQPIANQQVAANPVADAILAKKIPNPTPGNEYQASFNAELDDAARRFQQPLTYRQLNQERMDAGNRLDPEYNRSPSKQAVSSNLDGQVLADRVIQNVTRDMVFDAMQQHYIGQLPPDYFANLKRTQSALIDIKNQLAKRKIEVSNMESVPAMKRVRMHAYGSGKGRVGLAVGNLAELLFPEYKAAHAAADKGLTPPPRANLGSLLMAPSLNVLKPAQPQDEQ